MPAPRLVRRLVAGVIVVWSCLLVPVAAQAQDVPFAFLIKDGWRNFYLGQAARIGHPLVSWYGHGTLHSVQNGQKGAVMGTGFIQAYTRAVPEQTFSAILPLGGLITLDFGTFQGHLALFETPSGIRTTVSVIDANGVTDTRLSGSWVIGDGSAVGGGTAEDMVVGVLVHFGQPQPAGTVPVVIPPYFPLVPFPNDLPFARYGQGYVIGPPGTGLGNSYGQAQGPLRVYSRLDDYGLGFQFAGALLVMHMGGGDYAVLACSRLAPTDATAPPIEALVRRCTISGVGPVLGRLTGSVTSFATGALQERVMQWAPFSAP